MHKSLPSFNSSLAYVHKSLPSFEELKDVPCPDRPQNFTNEPVAQRISKSECLYAYLRFTHLQWVTSIMSSAGEHRFILQPHDTLKPMPNSKRSRSSTESLFHLNHDSSGDLLLNIQD